QALVLAVAQQAEAARAQAEALRGSGGSSGSGPPGPPPVPSAPQPEPEGWDSAPDLAAARDAMPRLGEVPVMREVHILDGEEDGQSGGHRWDSDVPGATKFPRTWDDDKILETIGDVSQWPDRVPVARPKGGW